MSARKAGSWAAASPCSRNLGACLPAGRSCSRNAASRASGPDGPFPLPTQALSATHLPRIPRRAKGSARAHSTVLTSGSLRAAKVAASLGGEQPSVCVKNVSGTLPPAAASRSIAFRRRRKGRRRAAGVRTEPDVGAQAILDEVSTGRVEARDRERHNPLRAQDPPRQPAIAHLAQGLGGRRRRTGTTTWPLTSVPVSGAKLSILKAWA